MARSSDYLTIGQAARRCGVTTSTLRFYEQRGLIRSIRNAGNQRRYHRSTLRRISVIRVAQGLGLTLAEIDDALGMLPDGRTPTRRGLGALVEDVGGVGSMSELRSSRASGTSSPVASGAAACL